MARGNHSRTSLGVEVLVHFCSSRSDELNASGGVGKLTPHVMTTAQTFGQDVLR
jgi:hypothetical protein